ncbi:hypothetical protein [Pseudaminobacter sp. NGMCC 1.201702]|uniref:hypothetical protein n=1 Tax=Pseudaminobacter sp. NGMCC 1.201702 TaxID=3391825 RepID=UPI0039EE358F
MITAAEKPATKPRGRVLALSLAAAAVAVLLAANAHFVYVAVTSQPDCVPHSKDIGSDKPGTAYRAAKSAC